MKTGESRTKIVRSLRNGQVTIPAEFRRQLGIDDDSLLQVTLSQGELRIKPVRTKEQGLGTPWLKELYDRFAPIREEASTYSEEEINADIDRAVRAVRQGHD
jgi:AbrB family looped-hinge helix DNA binding protein